MTSAPSGRPSPRRTGRRGTRARESEREPDVGRRVQALAEGDAVEERHPDRDRADEQRGDAGRHGLLRPGERAVARARRAGRRRRSRRRSACDRCGRPPGRRAEVRTASRTRARDEVPHGHREEGRQVANHDRERDERRAPDEVDRHQGEPDPHAVIAPPSTRMPARRRSAQVDLARRSIRSR